MLKIDNLHASVAGKEILKGLSLDVKAGEVHAIMGPNGAGKSTLGNILSGREGYEVTDGTVLFEGADLLQLEPEQRAAAGIFLAFQYPVEIPGVNNTYFLRAALNAQRKARGEAELDSMQFLKLVREKLAVLHLKDELLHRGVNEGFSGGEKKRNEIFQRAVLEPIWTDKTETASRLRGRIEMVLDWATARGYRTGENPARWRGHLDQLLAKPRKLITRKHYEALPIDAVGTFLVELRKVEGASARALEFVVLTAGRSGEIRGAHWSEIDLVGKVWTVPAERMKAKKEHRVPLSSQALKLLEELPRFEAHDLLFPGRSNAPLSDMSLTRCMRRMNLTAVPHGFRSTFRDWAAERTNFPRDLAEMALAHTIESEVERAYRRGDMLAKRARMMQAWSDFCSRPAAMTATVVSINAT